MQRCRQVSRMHIDYSQGIDRPRSIDCRWSCRTVDAARPPPALCKSRCPFPRGPSRALRARHPQRCLRRHWLSPVKSALPLASRVEGGKRLERPCPACTLAAGLQGSISSCQGRGAIRGSRHRPSRSGGRRSTAAGGHPAAELAERLFRLSLHGRGILVLHPAGVSAPSGQRQRASPGVPLPLCCGQRFAPSPSLRLPGLLPARPDGAGAATCFHGLPSSLPLTTGKCGTR